MGEPSDLLEAIDAELDDGKAGSVVSDAVVVEEM